MLENLIDYFLFFTPNCMKVKRAMSTSPPISPTICASTCLHSFTWFPVILTPLNLAILLSLCGLGDTATCFQEFKEIIIFNCIITSEDTLLIMLEWILTSVCPLVSGMKSAEGIRKLFKLLIARRILGRESLPRKEVNCYVLFPAFLPSPCLAPSANVSLFFFPASQTKWILLSRSNLHLTL